MSNSSYYYYKKKINKGKIIKDIIFIYFITVVIVLLFNSLLFQAYKVPSDSMAPTLKENSRILVDKFSIGPKYPLTNARIFDSTRNSINRGDVIVFMSNEYYNRSSLFRSFSTLLYTLSFTTIDLSNIVRHYDSNIYVKRVIGVPGDHIRYRLINDTVVVMINGVPEKEVIVGKYQTVEENKNNSKLLSSMMLQNEFVVKDNEYYVLGDNRVSSSDSRIWGSVKKDQIIGKAFFRYWPVTLFGVIK